MSDEGEASLTVRDRVHKGWTDVSVMRSMESLAGTFDIRFTERWSDLDEAIPIRAGDACKLKLDDTVVIKGYVDSSSVGYDAQTHTMSASGRSLGDIVDCSAIYKKGRWRNTGLLTIAKNLCDQFDISVTSHVDLGDPFTSFVIQDGETVFEALERACRMRGVVMQSTPEGGLDFVKIGANKTLTVLELGRNIVSGTREESFQDRYSKYIVKTQAPGNDDSYGVAVAHPQKTVYDKEIKRFRPLVVHADSQATAAGLDRRAKWEANVRAGRSRRVNYRVQGWYCAEGIWQPNTLVQIRDPFLELSIELLTVDVKQTKSASGTFTDLTLADPITLTTEPLEQKKSSKKNNFYLGTVSK